MAIVATVNEPVVLSMLATDGRVDLHAQFRIYNSSNTLLATVNPAHVAEGLYQAVYTPTTEGDFSIVGQFYFDIPRTVDAGYEKHGESLNVNSIKTNIARLLGLAHENAVVDQQTYNGDGLLTSARLRVYDSAANAAAAFSIVPAAYNTGLKFIYQVQATYSTGDLASYMITRVQ